MSVLLDLTSQRIQGGHVGKLTLVGILVHPLHSVWVALNTAECVAGHWVTSGVLMVLFWGTILEDEVLMLSMWMVCL